MPDRDQPVRITSEISGVRGPGSLQVIDANYYYLMDAAGQPAAGLLIFLDRLHRPVRAEVHLFEELDSQARESTLRQARAVLQERYYSREPVNLRVMQTYQERAAMSVTLPDPARGKQPAPRASIRWQPLAMLAVIALLAVAAIWGITRFFAGEEAASQVEEATVQPAPAGSGQDTPQTNNLPPSRNARGDLAVGMRVRILPGFQLALRSEPGAAAGQEVAPFQDGQEATIVGGPVWTQGQSDTIVWWRVRLDDGVEGWAAANTSQMALLEPVESQ